MIIENQILDKEDVENLIPSQFLLSVSKGKVKCEFVGYIRQSGQTPIIILPKTFSEEIVDNYNKGKKEIIEFINKFIIIQYLVIKKYSISTKYKGNIPDDIIKSNEVTYFDVALAVINFYMKHKYLYKVVRSEKKGNNPRNIKWDNEINACRYKVIDDNIIFDDFKQKELELTNNDFLLSLLNTEITNIEKVFGRRYLGKNDITLDKKVYNKFMKNPIKNLRRIKKRYFRDEYLKLIKVLLNYYSIKEATDGKSKYEFLLTNNFQMIFENMVDDFLSDTLLINDYKYNKDGKIIDHLFEYDDLINNSKYIYIGDSKYYSDISNIKSTKWKQFSYAKNIQNYILSVTTNTNLKYIDNVRDNNLYGYNIVPNFFISPYIDLKKGIGNIKFFRYCKSEKPLEFYYYTNQLFDRDSMFIFYFEIDLLFLMNGYIKGFKEVNKIEAKKIVRDNIIKFFNEEYKFYFIEEDIDYSLEVLKNKYYLFQGKSMYLNKKNSILIALRNDKIYLKENLQVIDNLKNEGIKYKDYKLY